MISSRSSFGIIFGVSFHLQIPRSRGKEKVMSRRIPCGNSSVKTPRCGSECLKATQIPTKAVSVHCALPPPPPSPRSPLHHYRTPDPTRWPRGPARGPSAPLCGVGTTSRAAPRAPPAPGVWVARGPWCHRGSCALLGCCESPRDPCQQPGGSLRVGAVQGEQVPYPKGEQKRCDGGQCSRAFNVEQEG